jgi:hydroxypyruvate reductase
VEFSEGALRVGERRYELNRYSQVLTIAIGKAAHSMAEALRKRIGEHATGIIAAPHAPNQPWPVFLSLVCGNPLPNTASLSAGAAILDTLNTLDENSLVIYLISGGASAVVESPIDPQFRLEDIVTTYRALLHSGASIAQMNAVRKHLSATKGGRMTQAAGSAEKVSLLISDVPKPSLDALASGPTMPDSTTCEDCYDIAERYGLLLRLPEHIKSLFTKRGLQETPKADDPAFAKSHWHTLLSSEAVQEITAAQATAARFSVEIDNTCDDWDYQRAADYLLDRLDYLRKRGARTCIVSAGEVTVSIPAEPGIGGRNQQFALYCAQKIAGQPIAVLSAGTDGIDGNSSAAGAVIDGETLSRAGSEAASHALKNFNANPLLQSIGDAIVTGPTGNNLRDLRMLLAE